MWIITHLEDVCSDMSAIHGIRDVTKMSGPVFFAMAYRLDSYEGAVRAAAAREAGEGPVVDQQTYEAQQRYDQKPMPANDAPALTKEQLTTMFPAAPQIGQEVGMFEIAEMRDA